MSEGSYLGEEQWRQKKQKIQRLWHIKFVSKAQKPSLKYYKNQKTHQKANKKLWNKYLINQIHTSCTLLAVKVVYFSERDTFW